MLFIHLFWTCSVAQSQTVTRDRNLVKATKISYETFKTNGINGLIYGTVECYQDSNNPRFYCVYFDLASRRIDQLLATAKSSEVTDFFADEQFGGRVGPILLDANMTMQQANEFMTEMTPIINEQIQKHLMLEE